jgi:hypothetical protein
MKNCTCEGMCHCPRYTIKQVENLIGREIKSETEGFTDKQLNQLSDLIRNILSGSAMLDKVWQDGFIKGFDVGFDKGKQDDY